MSVTGICWDLNLTTHKELISIMGFYSEEHLFVRQPSQVQFLEIVIQGKASFLKEWDKDCLSDKAISGLGCHKVHSLIWLFPDVCIPCLQATLPPCQWLYIIVRDQVMLSILLMPQLRNPAKFWDWYSFICPMNTGDNVFFKVTVKDFIMLFVFLVRYL